MLMPVDEIMTEHQSQNMKVNKPREESVSSFGSFSMSSLSGFGKVLSTAVGSESGSRSESHHTRSTSGGALSFVGAISGVKSMMGGMTPVETQKSVPKEVRRIVDTFRSISHLSYLSMTSNRLLPPCSHLGVVLAFDEIAQQPLNASSALRFRFYRTLPHTSEAEPIHSPDLHQSWYTPSADDIGSVISVHCSSVADEKVCRYVSCEVPLTADAQLIDMVDNAIRNNYFGVKRVVICSSRGSSRSNSMDSHESTGGRPRLQRSDSCGNADLEVGGSIEVSSEHVLLREKDKNDCGVSLIPSPHMHVECVAPTSLHIYAPVHVLEHTASATPINSIHDLQHVKHKRMVNWLGPPRGALFYGLKDYLNESLSHRRAASASMVDQLSMTELLEDGHSVEHVLPGEILRLTIVCRDRLTRDALVTILRSMTVSLSPDTDYEASVPLRLQQLPWTPPVPPSNHLDAENTCHGDSGVSALTDSDTVDTSAAQHITCLELEIERLRQELDLARMQERGNSTASNEEQVVEAIAPTSELADLVIELQQRLAAEEEKTAHLESALSKVMIENSELVAQHALEIASLENEISDMKALSVSPHTPAASSTREEVTSPQQQYRIEMLERQLQAAQTRCEALLGELSQVIIPAEARYESPSVEVDGECYDSLTSVGIMASGIRAMTRDSMAGLIGEVESPARDGVVRRIESFRRIPEGDYHSDVLSLRDGVLRLQKNDIDDAKRKEIMDSMLALLDTILFQLSERPISDPNYMTAPDTNRTDLAAACDAPLPPSRSISSESVQQYCCLSGEGSESLPADQRDAESNDTALGDDVREKLVSLVNELRAMYNTVDEMTYIDNEDICANDQGNVELYLNEIRYRFVGLIKALSNSSTTSSASLSSLRTMNDSLQLQISSLNEQHNAVTDRLECEVGTLRKACEQAAFDLDSTHKQHQCQIDQFNEIHTSLKEKYDSVAAMLAAKEQMLVEVEARCEAAYAELFDEKSKHQSVLSQQTEAVNALSAAQIENAKIAKECNGLKKECARLKETIATVQRNKEPLTKIKADMENALAALEMDKKQLLQDKERIEGENNELVQYIGVLEGQCEEGKARIAELTDRVALLQAETLHLSDDRQHISKQLASYDSLRHQITQLRSQLVESDQTLHATKNMLHETIAINETLEAQHKEMETTIQTANATIAKKSLDLVEMHAQLEALEKCQKTYEKDKAGLRKENARLREVMIKLEEDRESLYKLRPVYNEQFCELTRCRSTISTLEEELNIYKQSDVEKRSLIADLEETVVQLECRAENCLLQANRSGMIAQNDYHNTLKLATQLCDLEKTINKLSGELEVARQAEPLKIKQLEYLLARAVGEKNHFENKAKSLSKDLQAKLLAGTPLQRELGRVMKRLEEVENERNAFRDAMMLSCDMYAPKDYSLPWLESLMK